MSIHFKTIDQQQKVFFLWAFLISYSLYLFLRNSKVIRRSCFFLFFFILSFFVKRALATIFWHESNSKTPHNMFICCNIQMREKRRRPGVKRKPKTRKARKARSAHRSHRSQQRAEKAAHRRQSVQVQINPIMIQWLNLHHPIQNCFTCYVCDSYGDTCVRRCGTFFSDRNKSNANLSICRFIYKHFNNRSTTKSFIEHF